MITEIELSKINVDSCLLLLPFYDEEHIESLANRFRTSGTLMHEIIDNGLFENNGVYYFHAADGFRESVWMHYVDAHPARRALKQVMHIWGLKWGVLPEIIVYAPEQLSMEFASDYAKRIDISILWTRYRDESGRISDK